MISKTEEELGVEGDSECGRVYETRSFVTEANSQLPRDLQDWGGGVKEERNILHFNENFEQNVNHPKRGVLMHKQKSEGEKNNRISFDGMFNEMGVWDTLVDKNATA